MANTEILAALKQVRTARDAANLARLDRTLSPEQQGHLTQIYLDLDDLEGRLILNDLRGQLDGLKQDTADLSATVGRIQASTDSLKTVASLINSAATAVNAVVSIVTAAASAGLG